VDTIVARFAGNLRGLDTRRRRRQGSHGESAKRQGAQQQPEETGSHSLTVSATRSITALHDRPAIILRIGGCTFGRCHGSPAPQIHHASTFSKNRSYFKALGDQSMPPHESLTMILNRSPMRFC
jgi:hypothetical protein